MHGEQTLILKTRRLEYRLAFNSKVTVIGGNSGTGKTALCSLLSEFLHEGKNSAYSVESSCPVALLAGDWYTARLQLQHLAHTLLVVDEDASYLESGLFAVMISRSSCYAVVMSHSMLKNIVGVSKEMHELVSREDGDVYVIENRRLRG